MVERGLCTGSDRNRLNGNPPIAISLTKTDFAPVFAVDPPIVSKLRNISGHIILLGFFSVGLNKKPDGQKPKNRPSYSITSRKGRLASYF